MKPLQGILVVSLEQAVAAPYCSVRLADSGARVIKIERPEGDFARYYDKDVNGESANFVWLNRGKESLAVDIKNKEDQLLLKKIISSADVYIQNLGPGAAERANLGSQNMRDLNKKLITCDISGYGKTGSYKERGAVCNILKLTEKEKQDGIILASAGNHSQGVAYHCKKFGIKCDIYMPVNTSKVSKSELSNSGFGSGEFKYNLSAI